MVKQLAITMILGTALVGCRATGWVSALLGSQEVGVPLTEFSALDGKYFPEFIRRFFFGAVLYEADYQTLGEARKGMKLIQVKQLSQEDHALNESNLSWSVDGAFLGFEVVDNHSRKIMVKDLIGEFSRELLVLPKTRQNFLDGLVIPSAHSYNAGLRWSRDSTRYAFMSNGGAGDYNIYVGAVGSIEMLDSPVARSNAKDGYASWSPKSNEMAFVSGRTGNGDIYVVNLGTQKLSRITKSENIDIFPEWTPDGNGVVFCSGDSSNHDIFLVRRKDKSNRWSRPKAVTNGALDELRPVVSPDGNLIAFYGRDEGSVEGNTPVWNIHVLPIDSVGISDGELASTIVARDVVIDLNTGPAWTPDSRKLVYVKRDPQEFNPIYGYDLYSGRAYLFKTETRMNRDILMSRLGVLSFRAQVGAWDRVFIALTNQGTQLQTIAPPSAKVNYLARGMTEKELL